MDKEFIAIFITCASDKEARAIADVLLRKRLIACANMARGLESRFWWKGKIRRADEVLVIMKTRRANFSKVERQVRRLHSYDVPEIVALPLSAGSVPYLKWLDDTLKMPR